MRLVSRRGVVIEGVQVDPIDLPLIKAHTWHLRDGYIRTQIKGEDGKWRMTMLHRLILDAPPGLLGDHINGDKLDNRRSNLRLASHAVNSQNRASKSNTASRFRGVSKGRNGWQVYVSGKYIGTFKDEIEAADIAHRVRVQRMPGYVDRDVTWKRG